MLWPSPSRVKCGTSALGGFVPATPVSMAPPAAPLVLMLRARRWQRWQITCCGYWRDDIGIARRDGIGIAMLKRPTNGCSNPTRQEDRPKMNPPKPSQTASRLQKQLRPLETAKPARARCAVHCYPDVASYVVQKWPSMLQSAFHASQNSSLPQGWACLVGWEISLGFSCRAIIQQLVPPFSR